MLGCSYGYQIAEDKQGGRYILFFFPNKGKWQNINILQNV